MKCGYTFHDFSGRWLSRNNLSCRQWLWVVRSFWLEVPPGQVASQLQLSRPTAYKALKILRMALAWCGREDASPGLARLVGAHLYPGEAWGGGVPGDTGGLSLAFLVSEVDGAVGVRCLPLEALSGREVAGGYLVGRTLLAGGAAGLEGVLLWHAGTPLAFARQEAGRVVAGALGEVGRFLELAARRYGALRGVRAADLGLHLKEWELRFNRSGPEAEQHLARCLCGLVPTRQGLNTICGNTN